MKKYRNIAYAGMFAALCTVMLFIGSVLQTLDLTAAALGSFVVMIALIELGRPYALGVYAAASVLSLLILPNKEPAVYFALFSGYYPILKVILNKIQPKALSYVARVAVFDISLAAIYLVFVYLLSIEADITLLAIVLVIAANAVFIVYDIAIEKASVLYVNKLRNHIFKGRR